MKVKDVAIDRINSELLLLILMGELVILTQRQYQKELNFIYFIYFNISLQYWPMRGVVSVTGSMSPTMEEKMVMANMIVTPAFFKNDF